MKNIFQLLLKIYFFCKPTKFHPYQARYPKPGKETSKNYQNDWLPVGWSIEDFKNACVKLGELLTIMDNCTHARHRRATRKDGTDIFFSLIPVLDYILLKIV